MGWISPTSHQSTDWTYEERAYDGNKATYAYDSINPGNWTGFIQLQYYATVLCDKVRFWARFGDGFTLVDIDVQHLDSSWHDVYQGTYTDQEWVEKSFSIETIKAVRFRFYLESGATKAGRLYDVNFYEIVIVAPTVTTQSCSNIEETSARGNGNITDIGYENATTRGFCYMEGDSGDPTTANSKVYDTGSFETGAFNKTISGLSPGTDYRVRAYAINSEGTGYGTTVQLTTDEEPPEEYDPPTVTTQSPDDITHNSATGNGNITDTGGVHCTIRGVCYSTSENPDVSDDKEYEEGSFGIGAFDVEITGLESNTKYYVRAYATNSEGTSYGSQDDFTTDKTTPVVTTQSPSAIQPTTATANGNILSIGGENCSVRGFKYGLTQVDTWDAHDDGSYGTGAFTKGLTGLVANTTYWIRAYATNGEGTSYGSWVEFQTSAVGVIPTGTKLDICSDYSGCTYQLQASETDDGEEYYAYFVISTDLTNKQGLAFYKRILDLHLYFMSEDSGVATIYVKRDNEATWQLVGSVQLTGDEDIIIRHLASDIRAKHFLFRISAANFFRSLGCLFEYIREDMR